MFLDVTGEDIDVMPASKLNDSPVMSVYWSYTCTVLNFKQAPDETNWKHMQKAVLGQTKITLSSWV